MFALQITQSPDKADGLEVIKMIAEILGSNLNVSISPITVYVTDFSKEKMDLLEANGIKVKVFVPAPNKPLPLYRPLE